MYNHFQIKEVLSWNVTNFPGFPYKPIFFPTHMWEGGGMWNIEPCIFLYVKIFPSQVRNHQFCEQPGRILDPDGANFPPLGQTEWYWKVVHDNAHVNHGQYSKVSFNFQLSPFSYHLSVIVSPFGALVHFGFGHLSVFRNGVPL